MSAESADCRLDRLVGRVKLMHNRAPCHQALRFRAEREGHGGYFADFSP